MTGGGAQDDDCIAQLMLSEPSIARITPEVIAQALEGFPLTPQRDMAWIARAVQAALKIASKNPSDGPDRTSNAKIRDELAGLADRASALWLDILGRSDAANSAIWHFAFHNWDGEGGTELEGGLVIGELAEHKAFTEAVRQLDWLSGFLARAARHTGEQKQSGPWRAGERRAQRIDFAMCLTPAFEGAFGQEATVNKWVRGDGRVSLGPWADFYQRVMAIAFGRNKKRGDIEAVLAEARRRHKASPVIFPPGFFPE